MINVHTLVFILDLLDVPVRACRRLAGSQELPRGFCPFPEERDSVQISTAAGSALSTVEQPSAGGSSAPTSHFSAQNTDLFFIPPLSIIFSSLSSHPKTSLLLIRPKRLPFHETNVRLERTQNLPEPSPYLTFLRRSLFVLSGAELDGGELFPKGKKLWSSCLTRLTLTAEMQLQLKDQMFTPVGPTRDLWSELTGVLFHGRWWDESGAKH